MDERQELMKGLQHALNLMKEAAEAQKDRASLQARYVRLLNLHKPWNKKKLIGMGIAFGLAGMYWTPNIVYKFGMLLSGTDFVRKNVGTGLFFLLDKIYLFGAIPVGILCGIFVPRIFMSGIKRKNKILKKQNEEIMEQNHLVEMAEKDVIERMQAINKQYIKDVLPWYPSDYCYIDAAESFLHYVRNYRADNIKEAINLYIAEVHRRRMEQTQQEILNNQNAMLREQRLNNILTIDTLAMQTGIKNALN